MKKAKSFFFWGTVCCCLFCFLQIWYPFYFYYVEQLQVFPLTWACFEETCRQPGGLACWLGGFLLQFYHLPLGGALVSTGLFLGIGVLMQRICRQTTSPVFCYLPALCPILALLPLHVDVNYRLQGTVAYCCMLGAFVLYVRIVVPWKRVLAVDGCFVCIGRAGGNLVRCRSRGPGDVVAGEGMARMSGTSVRDCPDALVVLSFLLAAGIPNDRFAGFLL